MIKISIVIPDSGPLITLAKANALNLLLCFEEDVKTILTDVVEFECTRYRTDYKDAQLICDFITENKNKIFIEETSYGKQAIASAKIRQQYEESEEIQKMFRNHHMDPPPLIALNAGEMSAGFKVFVANLLADFVIKPAVMQTSCRGG